VGYQVAQSQPVPNCKVAVKFKAQVKDPKVLGKISAHEPGFGTTCGKEFVIEQFQRDACQIGANLINITEQRHADFWSTCYRAKAELLNVKGIAFSTDPEYRSLAMQKQDHEDSVKAGAMIGGAVGAGVAAGVQSGSSKK
jgi:hypothetical protein